MSKPPQAPALVLFDIDGTILRRAGPHHRMALAEAIRQTTGLETTADHIPTQGMLDRDIVAWMLRDAGAGAARIRRAMPEIVRRAQQIYVRDCPHLARRVIPGVRGALNRIGRAGLVAGLVTGNLTAIGWHKMERAGLRHHFRFGAFAEQGRTRADLVRIAVRQARREGWIGRKAPVSLIGDHMNDVAAAKLNEVRAIAVATGVTGADELQAARPDWLLADLRSLSLEMLL